MTGDFGKPLAAYDPTNWPKEKWTPPPPPAQPHRCPICSGRGLVPCGFYNGVSDTFSTSPEKCRSCNGGGVLWR